MRSAPRRVPRVSRRGLDAIVSMTSTVAGSSVGAGRGRGARRVGAIDLDSAIAELVDRRSRSVVGELDVVGMTPSRA